MTSIEDVRQDYLNVYLHRADDSQKPWTDDECDRLIGDAITRLWPRLGQFVSGDVDSDIAVDTYTAAAALTATSFRLSRIDLVDGNGFVVDKLSNWRLAGADVLVRPRLPTGLVLRMYGWIPFAADGTDLLDDLVEAVGHRAAGRAYGGLAAELLHSERQQNLDSGRVVSYADAVGLSAYHERLYQDVLLDHPARLSYAPRAAHRR